MLSPGAPEQCYCIPDRDIAHFTRGGDTVSQRTRTRLLALVGVLTGERRAIHTGNYPLIPEKMLPLADVVILVADDDPGAMLFRYTAHGEFGGDTWHLTVEEAQESAIYEYGEALQQWEEVPAAVVDAHDFAVRYAHERLKDRGSW